MTFWITHLDGGMEPDPPRERFEALLDELDGSDVEHTNVAVSHESGWTLSLFSRGRLALENIEDDEGPLHRADVAREEALRLADLVSQGDITAAMDGEWAPGYPL